MAERRNGGEYGQGLHEAHRVWILGLGTRLHRLRTCVCKSVTLSYQASILKLLEALHKELSIKNTSKKSGTVSFTGKLLRFWW